MTARTETQILFLPHVVGVVSLLVLLLPSWLLVMVAVVVVRVAMGVLVTGVEVQGGGVVGTDGGGNGSFDDSDVISCCDEGICRCNLDRMEDGSDKGDKGYIW